MVLGLALLSWDNKIGSIIDFKYPGTLNLTQDLINKIYMSHSLKQSNVKEEELYELHYDDQVILSYCDKTRVIEFGYDMLILIIHEKEQINLYKLISELILIAQSCFKLPKEDRISYISENIGRLFKKTTERKILLLGRAGVGKTTLKEIIFEGHDPRDLLINPLSPTRGIKPSVYSWLDLSLGVFDSSGQELNGILNDNRTQFIAFENTDVIIYIFDFMIWTSKSKEIVSEIQDILDIIRIRSYDTKMILFLHKIDQINPSNRESDINDLKNEIQSKFSLPIYFTSIYPDFIYSIYNAFYEILSSFSEEKLKLKNILDNLIKEYSKIMCFITNQNNSIIIQSMSKDFNTFLINHSHKLIAQLNQSFEDMAESKIEHLNISSSNGLNIVMINLTVSRFNIKNLICISENLSSNKLILLGGKTKTELSKYLNLIKKY
ncbi:hypothetical protein LCGC14_0659520 [marine sediment metagenome]|uniref:G domain-containing protein n=1 Tax=marine sediment metagenome TaxID=412755 RepID=A0A0F9TFM3_9ZZZZ|nr:hypothetical protein [bacterium]